MDFLSIAFQLILSLSILVVLHECGHFFPARWFKTRVEKFYLFFDPWFSLFKIKRGDTEYGIGWIPFGGYVKISGMIDESMDKEQMKQPPQPWEFRSKKAWQRLIIMIGGVTVNFILGFVIFAMLLFAYGKKYIKTEDAKYGIAVDKPGEELGLKDGDKVIAINDEMLAELSAQKVKKGIVLGTAQTLTIDRNGEKTKISIDPSFARKLTSAEYKDYDLFFPRFPQEVSEVSKGSLAEKAGIKAGDRIIAVNGKSLPYLHEFAQDLRSHKNELIALSVLRQKDTLALQVQMDSTSRIGISNKGQEEFLTLSRKKYGFVESFPAGVKESMVFLTDQLKAFGQMFRGQINAKDNLGSVFSIAKMFDPSWDWERFWRITGMLSIILAFFNILPIPALDGGYVLFLIYEIISGKKPSDKFMEYVTYAGFILLMGVMIFALGNDISKFEWIKNLFK